MSRRDQSLSDRWRDRQQRNAQSSRVIGAICQTLVLNQDPHKNKLESMQSQIFIAFFLFKSALHCGGIVIDRISHRT